MQALLMSDLHTELMENPLVGMTELVDPILHYFRPKVLILAGDIVCAKRQSLEQIYGVFHYFANRADYVIYVAGNHDYWKGNRQQVEHRLEGVFAKIPNLIWLRNNEVWVEDKHFFGGTMWFPYREDTFWRFTKGERVWPDFRELKELGDVHSNWWIYKDNREFTEKAKQVVTRDTIVVTHHAPSFRSVEAKWQLSETNRFFICDQTELIAKNEPRLWVHGHVHDSFDYKLWGTRIVCNPCGYYHERAKRGAYRPVILEI